MFNKKTIIIITSGVVIFILSATLVFLWKTGSEDLGNKKITDNINLVSVNNLAENKIIADNLNELKNIHPEYSQTQLKFFSDTTTKGNIALCLNEPNVAECISAVAYLTSDRNICYELKRFEKNEILINQCDNTILKKIAQAEISRCNTLSGDDYYNCLTVLFNAANQKLDCAVLSEAETRSICQDVLNFDAALSSYDRALCKNVKTEKLNQYCLKVIIDKN